MQNKLILYGLFIVVSLLYQRIFKIRIPKEILPTQDIFVVSIDLLLCISTFIIATTFLYAYIKFLLNIENSDLNNNFFTLKIKQLYESKWNFIPLMSHSLLSLDIYLKNKIPKYDAHRDYLDVIVMFISKYFYNYQKAFIFIFISIPIIFQSIVGICFFIDVFINSKFHYFYKNLWLLIFPLIATYILHTIRALVDTNLNSLNKVLIFKIVKTSEYELYKENAPIFKVSLPDWRDISANTPKGFYLCINNLSQEYLSDNPDIKLLHHKEILNYCIESMNEYFLIYDFLDKYTESKQNILLPFNAFKYFMYFICWAGILYIHYIKIKYEL